MCGIIGGTDRNWNYDAAVSSLKHRGPDSQKVVPLPDIILGFARLAIIDLSREADQPMVSSDGSTWIVFNGEIYGFKRLREELISLGHIFRTHSDTEVILAAYSQWNDEFVHRIDGMFAIALYDLRSRQLKLFRDRAGIKPIYYFFDGKNFAFASELKGIIALCRDINFAYDYTALYDFLTYHYIPEPKSLYKNIFKLPPAHKLIFDTSKKEIISNSRYWQLSIDPHPARIDLTAACETLKALIRESVQDQLVSDVPVGCFLSGGMDSSTVVAEASSFKSDLETFSIGFNDPAYTETEYAEMTASKFKVRHHHKTLSDTKTSELFGRLKTWYDEPFADTSAFPTYLVSEYAKEKMTVVLTGDGGDEILGGYTRYPIFQSLEKLPRLPSKTGKRFFSAFRSKIPTTSFLYRIISGLEVLTGDNLALYGIIMEELPLSDREHYQRAWGISDDYDAHWYFRKYYREDLPTLTRLQYLDFHTYLPSDILTKVDRVSMAVSLEARVPFLSRKIIEFIFSLPEEIRFPGGQLKGLLKEAYKDVLPTKILNRKKMGFGIPFKYFNKNYANVTETILHEGFGIK